MAIDRGEINSVPEDVSIVGPLDGDVDARTGFAQTDRIALLQARNPDLLIEFKCVIRVRPVWFSSRDLAIICLPRESGPRIFAQYTPFLHHASLHRNLYHHIESGHDYQKRPTLCGVNMMEIIETGQGNEVLQPKTGDVVNQYLSGCTGIKLVTPERGRFEQKRRQLVGTDFWRRTYSTHRRDWFLPVEFDQDGLIARLPFFQLTEYGASQPASGNIEAIHPKIPIARNLSRISLTSSLLAFGSDCNAKRLENPSAIASGFQKRRFDELPHRCKKFFS